MKQMVRAVTPALLTAGLAALLLPAPALAADPGPSGVAVVEVGPWVEGGGYPTVGWGWNGISVALTDDSPGDGRVYTVTVTPTGGGEPVTTSWNSYDDWDGSAVPVQVGVHGDFALDTDYEVAVSELDGDTVLGTTGPLAYRHEAVGHPESGVLKQQRAGGRNTVEAGSKVRLQWTGSWEVGTSLTQVVYAVARNGTFKDRDFLYCEGSYCPTRKGVRWVEGGDEPLRSFRVPERLAGKRLVVVSYGSLGGEVGHLKAQWGWRWDLKIRKGS